MSCSSEQIIFNSENLSAIDQSMNKNDDDIESILGTNQGIKIFESLIGSC